MKDSVERHVSKVKECVNRTIQALWWEDFRGGIPQNEDGMKSGVTKFGKGKQ